MMYQRIKHQLDRSATGNASKGQTGAVVSLLLALVGGIIVALFHTNTTEVVADQSASAINTTGNSTTNVSSGAQSLMKQYDLIYVAAGLIGFFVLIMGAAT